MYAAHHPCWDAKNRYGLPDSMPMSFDEIAHLFTNQPEPDYRVQLRSLMSTMTPEQKTEIITKFGLNKDSTNEDYKNTYLAIKGGN